MISLSASADFGLSGQYVARITGRDSKFTFAREFIGAKYGKRNEGTSADVDDAGLYEVRDVTRKGKVDRFYVVLEVHGALSKLRSDKEDAMKIARALDERRAFGEIVGAAKDADGKPIYEILSAREAAKVQQAQTVTSAIETCWVAMQALPEKEAKKVLAALRARVSPPKPEAPTEPVAEPAHDTAGEACTACGGPCLIYRSPEASS